jgi:hypothetical protein
MTSLRAPSLRPVVVTLATLGAGLLNPLACDCDPEPIQSFTCDFEVTPSGEGSTIQFNATAIGDTSERTFNIKNIGQGVTLDQINITFESVNGEHFGVDIPEGTRITVNDDESFTVQFHPLAEADISSRFVVSHPDVGNAKCPSATVFVRGTGTRELDLDAGTPDGGDSDGGVADDAGIADGGTVEPPDGGPILPPNGEWFAYGGLEDARARFAAVELKDGSGDVLVIGGYGEDGEALDSIERLNPTTGISRVVAHMAVPRAEPGAVVLPGGANAGAVVILGGRSAPLGGFALRTVEVFDPTTNTLTCADSGGCGLGDQAAAALPAGRIGPTVSVTSTNQIVITLGRGLDDDGNEVLLDGGETLTLGSNTVGALGNANLLTGRAGAAQVVDPTTGAFLLVGGRNAQGNVLGEVLRVDGTGASVVGALQFPRAFGAATLLLASGTVMIAGGFSGTGSGVVDVELVTNAFGGNPSVADSTLTLSPRVGGSLLSLGGDIVLWAGGVPSRVDNLNVDDSVVPDTGADLVVPFGASSFLRVSPDNDLAAGRIEHQALVVGAQKDAAVFIGGLDTAPRRTPHGHVERFILDENRFLTFGLMGAGTALEAGVVASGTALVSAGGVDPHTGRVSSAIRAFDVENGAFVEAGDLREPRRDHSLTRIATTDDQTMLLAGGRDEAGTVLGSLSVVDPVNGTDRPLPVSLRTPRANHTATRLADGNPVGEGAILLCGGQGQGGELLDTCELVVPPPNPLDPNTYDDALVLPVAGRLSAGRVGHTATLLDTGEVLVVGGGDPSIDVVTADLFAPDDTTPFVRPTGQPVRARRDHAAVFMGSGRVLVVGGEVFDAVLGATRTAELYVRATETFTAVDDMEQERAAPAAFLLGDGNVLVAGGTRNNPNVPGVPTKSNITSELYVANADGTGTFEELPDTDLSYGRSDVQFVDVFGRAVVAGGTHRDGVLQTGDERRTPITFLDWLQDPADAFQP